MSKKINASVLAVLLTAAMFTGCGSVSEQAAETTASTLAEELNTETTTAETSAEETTSETTASIELTEEQLANIKAFYNSVDFEVNTPLSEAVGDLQDITAKNPDSSVSYADSNTKKLMDTLDATEEYYIVLKDEENFMETASLGDKMKLSICTPDTAAAMIFHGNAVYSYSPSDISAYKITLDDDSMAEYTKESLLQSAIVIPTDEEKNSDVMIYNISADGKNYTLELFTTFAYIFNEDNSVAMICDGTNNLCMNAITDNVDDSIFDLLKDYEVLDYDELFAALEESIAEQESSAAETEAETETTSETEAVTE